MYKFNRPYVRDRDRIFCPIYLPGETYSFYFNSDYNIDDTDYAGFQLWLIDNTGAQVEYLGPTSVVFLSPTLYNIYNPAFVFPIIPDGYYYLQIWDTFGGVGQEKARSNLIQVWSDCLYQSTPVKFRHDDQLYGVRYDLLPDFYQIFRLPIGQIKPPDVKSERESYRQSSNGRELRTSKSFRDLSITLEMYWCTDEDIEALSAMNEHSEVYISGNRLIQLQQIKPDYPSQWSNQTKANFEIIVDDYDIDRSFLWHWGDFIAWGGNEYGLVEDFDIGT